MRANNLAVKIFVMIMMVMSMQHSNAQTVVQQIQSSFDAYHKSTLHEKLFLHTDKTTYLPGEILWFKIYCVDANTNKPLNLSKVAYVEILDASQNAVIQAKIALKNGSGSGSVYIPVTTNSGYYQLRAYTSWMKNFSADFYFEKMLTVVNPFKSPEVTAKETGSNYDVQFFPEGGNLLYGVSSKVAFKAVGENGKGAAITGAIINQRNDTVVKFSSLKFGMGSFLFTPQRGGSYKAIIKSLGHAAINKQLPAINSQGYAMLLTDKGSQLQITVNGAGVSDYNVYLFAHTRKNTKAAEAGVLQNGTANFTIDKSLLGEGISHITIFNSARQPVCERLYFKRPKQSLLIDATADQSQYGTRKKVNITLSASDQLLKSPQVDMSIGVYRIDSLQEADKSNIFNYLWLGSELKGNIESPEYYFNDTTATTDEALDNLMLTQGWRRFEWTQVLANKKPNFSYLPEYYGHMITAKITNTITNAPAKDIVTYLGVPGKRVQLYTAASDSAGRLLYFTRDFYGPGELVAQTNQLLDSTYRIDIASPFSEQTSKTVYAPFRYSTNMSADLQAHSLGTQVINIYTGNALKRFDDSVIDSTAFYGQPGKVYKLDDYVRFTTMEEVLREYVKEDNIVNVRGKFHIKVLTHIGFLDGDPLVMMDGVPFFNINKIFAVDPLKVKKLEVVPNVYYHGPAVETGIFSFTTYKGDLGGMELDPRAVVIDYEGLQLQRQFYSPVYDTPQQTAGRVPDFRNLLYWSPTVTVQGKNAVSFYTSDQKGKYAGVIQALSTNGDAATKTFTFEVK